MRQALASGLQMALRRWPFVVVLFIANLAAGLCFMAVAWFWLSDALDSSLASRTLLTNLDWNVFIDLLVHRAQSLRMLLAGGVLLLFPALLLGIWLNAAAVVAVGEDGTLGDCLRRALTIYPTFFGLSVVSNLLTAAAITAGFLVGRVLTRWTAESASEMTFYLAAGAGVLVVAFFLVFFVTVHDHARVRSVASNSGALRAYGWALRFVARREWRAVPMALVLLGLGALAWLVYQTVGMPVATTSTHGVVVSLAWGETLLFARMLLRVWTFAAATELQGLQESSVV
jgi:hypothetical protein